MNNLSKLWKLPRIYVITEDKSENSVFVTREQARKGTRARYKEESVRGNVEHPWRRYQEDAFKTPNRLGAVVENSVE